MPTGEDGELVAVAGIDLGGAALVTSPDLEQAAADPPGPVFVAYNAGTATAAGAPFTAPIDTVSLNTPGFVFAGNAVTLTEGTWYVEADVTLQATTSNRTNFDCWLTADGSQIPGSIGMAYLRQTNYGATPHLAGLVTVPAAGSVDVGVVVDRTHGNTGGSFIVGGTRLMVHRV